MSAGDMRDLLLRVQSDADFAELVRTDPSTAAAQYVLTEREREILRAPGGLLQGYLVPRHRLPASKTQPEPGTISLDEEPPPDELTFPITDPMVPPMVEPPPDELTFPITDPMVPPPNESPPSEVGPGEGGLRGGRLDAVARQALIDEILLSAAGEVRRAQLISLLKGLNVT